MTQTRTADDVARLFAERDSTKLFFRLSDKQVRWIAALARDSKISRSISHGYNSIHAGSSTRHSEWTGTFCNEHSTSWKLSDGNNTLTIEPCQHRPLRTSTGKILS